MSVVGRLKEELSGVGLKVWTMCLRCSWSTSIRDTCTMEERECVCVHAYYMWFWMLSCHVYIHVYTYMVRCAYMCACVCACTQMYFVLKRPLQERVKFSSHENEEDREVSLVANTITI